MHIDYTHTCRDAYASGSCKDWASMPKDLLVPFGYTGDHQWCESALVFVLVSFE